MKLPPMFTAKWKKEALLLAKGSRKFVNYKRDLLKPDRIAEIESRRSDLLAAVKAGDRDKVDECSKQLRGTCENSLKGQHAPSWWQENVEVIFVAIVIALGLRTYVVQPFRIPTGSMQPTLNGIIVTPLAESEWPSAPQRAAEWILRGRSYEKIVNDRDRPLLLRQTVNGPQLAVRDIQHLHFFSRSVLEFADGSSVRLPALTGQMHEAGFLNHILRTALNNRGILPAGTVICEGTFDAGDLILVDRVSYNFRKPERGEVFVFDTRGINTKQDGTPQSLEEQAEGTHYIKRLAGLPGDTLEIAPPHLLIDGEIAQESGFENVYTLPLQRATEAQKFGYTWALQGPPAAPLTKAGDQLRLKADGPTWLREYAALGDNSGNSLDSRYWGSVREYNVVGPALFSLWPITTGHWGIIR